MPPDVQTDGSPEAPARPRRLTVRFDQAGDRLEVSRQGDPGVPGTFLFLWLIGWTVGCVWLAYEAIHNPGFFSILFGIPFWSSWIFVCCMLLKSWLLYELVWLDRQGLGFNRRAIIPLSSRMVPIADIQSFGSYSTVADSESGQCKLGIEMRTLGKPVRFFEGLPEQERLWLQFQFTSQLDELRRAGHVTPVAATQNPDGVPDVTTTQPLVERPSDSRWYRLDDFSAIQFVERGRWNLSMLLALLFVNAFWNGIVSVFLVGLFGGMPGHMPQGWMWWGMIVFLIPFEVIGLAMFTGLVVSLLEPLRRSVWRFDSQEIESATTWLGVGPHNRYPVGILDRVEVRRSNSEKPVMSRCSLGHSGDGSGRSFELALIDQSNTELCTISGLTEGEAQWIAHVLLRERSKWFR